MIPLITSLMFNITDIILIKRIATYEYFFFKFLDLFIYFGFDCYLILSLFNFLRK